MGSRSVIEIKSEVPHEKSWKIRQNPAGTVVEYNLQIYGIKVCAEVIRYYFVTIFRVNV